MNATGYLIYSAALGTGDLAVVFDAISAPLLWRPLAGAVGLASYAGTMHVAARVLRDLVDSRILAASSIERCCAIPYWSGGVLMTAGALFNPVSPWQILTSGAAVGFGAMVGLLLLPRLLPPGASADESPHGALSIGWPWLAAGTVAAILFVGLFGPGIRFAA
jgi:hypothetical protein